MGEKFGKNLDEDTIDFIDKIQLDGNFPANSVEEKLKSFIFEQAKKFDIKIFTAKCASESYKLVSEEYNPTVKFEFI